MGEQSVPEPLDLELGDVLVDHQALLASHHLLQLPLGAVNMEVDLICKNRKLVVSRVGKILRKAYQSFLQGYLSHSAWSLVAC